MATEWERAIATYRESYRQLVVLAVHLLETGRDLSAAAEIIDGLTESQAKGILKVVVASDAEDYKIDGDLRWSYPTN